MTAKELFLKDKELAAWWVSVCHDDRFERVLLYVRSALMDTQPERTEIKGAETVLAFLATISDNDPDILGLANPGLHHMIDKMPDKTQNPTD